MKAKHFSHEVWDKSEYIRPISTKQLIHIIVHSQDCTVEAALVLCVFEGGYLRATHFLEFSRGRLHDIGIDSVAKWWEVHDFVRHYDGGRWIIDQVVRHVYRDEVTRGAGRRVNRVRRTGLDRAKRSTGFRPPPE